MKGMRNILWMVPLLAVASCTGECYDNQNALPLAKFINSAGKEVPLNGVEVHGVGAPGDSLLWSGEESAQELYLPFQIDRDRTTYVFRDTATDITDTVRFEYVRNAVFASYECGVSYIYELKSITSQGELIDSVVCPSGKITNSVLSNLIIYLHDENE